MLSLKLMLLFTISCAFIQPAFAQEKYFKITDSGEYYFFNDASVQQNKVDKGENNYVRPITARTFFLEAKKAQLFSENMTFIDFEKMSVTQQQHLLDSLQQDFDWSKYRVHAKEENSNAVKSDYQSDTTYSVANLAFDKESNTLAGELVSGMGRRQQFMIYPVGGRSSNEDVQWIIEWVDPGALSKKKGYKNLNLSEQKVYELLKEQGIDLKILSNLTN